MEQKERRIRHIHENRTRFGIGNLQVVQARLPEGTTDLPSPDRVFIGGGGNALTDIIRSAAHRLKPSGIIVINTVLIDNLTTAVHTLEGPRF